MIATTTLNKIRAKHPCEEGWKKLLTHLGKTKADDEVVTLKTVLESNAIDDALWTLRASDAPEATMRAYACWCALSVAHLWDMPAVVREYLETQDESKRDSARAAVGSAAWDAARAAAWDAAWAAVGSAAWDSARAAAWDAVRAAAWDAVRAAVGSAVGSAARAAAWDAARAAQKQQFIAVFCTEEGDGLK